MPSREHVARRGPTLVVVRHPGVAEPAVAAQPDVIDHAENVHRGLELTEAVRAQVVGLLGGEMGQILDQHLAFLAQRAGHQRHGRALGDVLGHGRPVADRLVVGVGMHHHEPPVGGVTRLGR